MIRFALPIAALSLSACWADTPPKPAPAPAPAPGVECNSNGLAHLIGKPRSAEIGAEAKRISGANVLRWITPGMMVTMEFRSDRLNLQLGTDGRILAARCG